MTAERKRFYTLEEYLALVRESDERYEYYDGEIFCMTGGSKEQVFIIDNVTRALGNKLMERNCRAMSSEMPIKVPSAPPFRYADATVGCGELEFEKINGIDVLVNPVLLIEVLSQTTQRFNRNIKFQLYKSIPSFKEYLLIAQTEPCITQFIKPTVDHEDWRPAEVTGLDSSIYLPSIDCTLELTEVYQGVKF